MDERLVVALQVIVRFKVQPFALGFSHGYGIQSCFMVWAAYRAAFSEFNLFMASSSWVMPSHGKQILPTNKIQNCGYS
jgi:hypothetical protein